MWSIAQKGSIYIKNYTTIWYTKKMETLKFIENFNYLRLFAFKLQK